MKNQNTLTYEQYRSLSNQFIYLTIGIFLFVIFKKNIPNLIITLSFISFQIYKIQKRKEAFKIFIKSINNHLTTYKSVNFSYLWTILLTSVLILANESSHIDSTFSSKSFWYIIFLSGLTLGIPFMFLPIENYFIKKNNYYLNF